MLARRLSQSSSEQTLPEVVYIFQCCNNLQDIQYDHAGIRLVASLVKLPLTISPWQGSTMSVSNPFGSELLWISVSVTAYLLYNDYDQGWQKSCRLLSRCLCTHQGQGPSALQHV